jgi:hypothetical protein
MCDAVQNKYDLVNPYVFKINGVDFNIGNDVLKWTVNSFKNNPWPSFDVKE